ncbi:MAG: GHKL domain-containing protein [Eubacteriales bacterium]|nr:GHKL domain-containing protein [Eubacteriales bacterium]
MLKTKSGEPGRILCWAAALIYLLLAAAVLALFHSYTVTDQEQLYLTPIFTDSKGWDIYRPDGTGGRAALTPKEAAGTVGTVCLSRVLEPAYEQAGYTTLETDGPVSVFLDGELLYTTAPGSGGSEADADLPAGYEVPAAGETPRLTLPPGYGGRTLTLVFARDEETSGTPMVILSSRAAEDALTASQANRLGMPAAAYMTAAFLLLGLLLYGGVRGRWDWPALLLALAAALQAFYQLREYSFRIVYHSALDIRAAALIPPLFVALPLGYLLCRMGRRHRLLRTVCVLLPAAAALLPSLCYLFDRYLPARVNALCGWALHLSLAVTLVCAAWEARGGNRLFRLFWTGLGMTLAALGAACLLSGSVRAYIAVLLRQTAYDSGRLLYWCGAVLFVLCAAMSVSEAIRRTAEGWAEAELLSARVSALQNRLETARAADEAIRIERHDLRHKLQTLAALVEKDEKAEALAYIGASQARLDETKPARLCPDLVLDAVLSSYFDQARRRGIRVDANLAFPDKLPADAAELSTVFANALENAIHACEKLPAGTPRRIEVAVVPVPHFCVEIANTCGGTVELDGDGFPVSHEPGHGVGTRSMAAFFEKYKAVYQYKLTDDGMFRLRFLIGRPHEKSGRAEPKSGPRPSSKR